MIARRILETVEQRLSQMPGVVLLGPRQVGKTTLARSLARSRAPEGLYLDLERAADRRRLTDADAFLRDQPRRLVVLDEIHRAPELFETLRGIIDDRRAAGERAGHFLLLGSASLDLMQQTSESLAGRVAHVEMMPIDVSEIGESGIVVDSLWLRGGFPDSVTAPSDRESLAWRRDFLRSYLERDVPMFAPRLPAAAVGRLWEMLAHGHGSLLNHARLASSLGVSSPAVGRYIDLLVDLLLVRRLRPWSGNLGKRLVRSPKVYVRDAGVLHALLEIETAHALLGHPIAGPSWEGFVIENLIAVADAGLTPSFLRTARGAEIDLVFERGGRVEFAIEIKRSTAPTVSRGFREGCHDLSPRAAFVVHGGSDEWPMGGDVTAISLSALMQRLRDARLDDEQRPVSDVTAGGPASAEVDSARFSPRR
ncbi:ATP-binding protein [Gemmatimonas sp.]|uniref:ATP-binding protein n=1 Tax=Gemmatimonas sp. TaxID=1962908 RepID=UPI00286E6BE0|nr:ATP-binding protein [Gemmatimonas sp.]